MGASMRWVRSLAAADGIGALVADRCGFRVTGCELVRSLTNDVYRVETAGGVFACKVYATGSGHVVWEQDLAAHLSAAGVSAAAPVTLRDGTLVGTLDAPEGARPFAVTVWAVGDKPRPPWTYELFRRYGVALARLHSAADGFTSAHPARTETPLSTLDAALRAVTDPVVHEMAAAARQRLATVTPDVGVRHGDASLDNLHMAPDGALLWHDFDLAAVGWRGADLTGAFGGEHWPAFLDGYASTGRTPDTGAVLALRVVELVRNIAWHLTRKVALRGTESVAEGWVEREMAGLLALRGQL